VKPRRNRFRKKKPDSLGGNLEVGKDPERGVLRGKPTTGVTLLYVDSKGKKIRGDQKIKNRNSQVGTRFTGARRKKKTPKKVTEGTVKKTFYEGGFRRAAPEIGPKVESSHLAVSRAKNTILGRNQPYHSKKL